MDLPAQDAADIFQEVFQAVAVHLQHFRSERPGRHLSRLAEDDHAEQGSRPLPKSAARAASRRRNRGQAWWSRIPDAADRIDEAIQRDEEHGLFHRALELIQNDFEESDLAGLLAGGRGWAIAPGGRRRTRHESGRRSGRQVPGVAPVTARTWEICRDSLKVAVTQLRYMVYGRTCIQISIGGATFMNGTQQLTRVAGANS